MGLVFTIKTDFSGLNSLEALMGAPRPIMAAAGKGVEKQLRSWFLGRDKEGNKRGWTSKHFWNREVRSNTALGEVSDAAAAVVISSPAFAQKMFGGTIKPKRGKFLALPLTADAYQAGSPREGGFDDLFCVKSGKGNWFLAVHEGKALRLKYRLVRSVTQAADPRALPPQEELEKTVVNAAESVIRRVAG